MWSKLALRGSLLGATVFALISLAGIGAADSQTSDVATEEVVAAPGWGATSETTIKRSVALVSCSYPDVCETTTTTEEIVVAVPCVFEVIVDSNVGTVSGRVAVTGCDFDRAVATPVSPDGTLSEPAFMGECPTSGSLSLAVDVFKSDVSIEAASFQVPCTQALTTTTTTTAEVDCTNLVPGANLAGCQLSYADLSGVDLSGANLTRTFLASADLTGANLSGANLLYVNLSYADLSGADLTGADLYGPNLAHADLTGADLTGADLTIIYSPSVVWSDTTCPDGSNSDTNGRNSCP